MKRIYAIRFIGGKPSTLHEFTSKDALVSYAKNSGRGEATEGNPTIDKLLNALGMTRIYANELNKYTHGSVMSTVWRYHYTTVI